MPPKRTTEVLVSSKASKIQKKEPTPEPEVESDGAEYLSEEEASDTEGQAASEDKGQQLPEKATAASIGFDEPVSAFEWNAPGQPVLLSAVEVHQFGIRPDMVAGIRYGDRVTSWLGFPLLSYPSDSEGLVVTYSHETNQNVFYTPNKKYRGGIRNDDDLPFAKAAKCGEATRYTDHFLRLADVLVLLVTAVVATSGETRYPAVAELPSLLSGEKKLDPCTLLTVQVFYRSKGGDDLKKLPPDAAQKFREQYPSHPDVLLGKSPVLVTLVPQYQSYFKNGIHRINHFSAPTTNKANYSSVAALFEFLGDNYLQSVKKGIDYNRMGMASKFEIKNPEIARYVSPYRGALKTWPQTVGELLEVGGWDPMRFPKVALILQTYFSTWLNEAATTHKGKRNTEPEMLDGAPAEANFMLPKGEKKKK